VDYSEQKQNLLRENDQILKGKRNKSAGMQHQLLNSRHSRQRLRDPWWCAKACSAHAPKSPTLNENAEFLVGRRWATHVPMVIRR
jgi:hypothetical protein